MFYCPFVVCYYCIRMVAAGNVDATTLTLVALIPTVCGLFCCVMGCCRASFCVSLWLGICVSSGLSAAAAMNNGETIHVNGVSHASRRIAIVGGGPSGATAAWVLAKDRPDAKVDVFEYNPRAGGHSDTVMANIPDPVTGANRSVPIDIGFIFSTPSYRYYLRFVEKFNYSYTRSAISVMYHGDEARDLKPWNNANGDAGQLFTAAAGDARSSKLSYDLRKFSDACTQADQKQMSTLELMCPLDIWLWFNGYSRDFYGSALLPMLTPLFVTQNGNSAQSAGATCSHFGKSGFLSFNVSDHPPVFHTNGGVQFMYEEMLQQVESECADCTVRTNTEVIKVAPSAGGWKVSSRARSTGVVTEAEYDEVILAVNAHIGEALLAAGGEGEAGRWPSCDGQPNGAMTRKACRHGADRMFRAFRSWAMRNTEYEWTDVTLTELSPEQPEHSFVDELYHIWREGVMTGTIDKILDLTPHTDAGRYRLRVAPSKGSEGFAPDNVAPDVNPVLAKRSWQHHRFNLWEHLLVFRILAHFNDYDGLHVAGDWTRSIGQNAALQSGVRAACAVGLREETKQMLAEMGVDPSDVHAC